MHTSIFISLAVIAGWLFLAALTCGVIGVLFFAAGKYAAFREDRAYQADREADDTIWSMTPLDDTVTLSPYTSAPVTATVTAVLPPTGTVRILPKQAPVPEPASIPQPLEIENTWTSEDTDTWIANMHMRMDAFMNELTAGSNA